MTYTARLPETTSPAISTLDAIKPIPLRVLVVDDNVINQIVVEALLRRDGHIVVLASDGAQAVEAVRAGNFDVVLMDMQMPVLNGVDATRAIRQLSGSVHDVPIIAVTANALSDELNRCYDAGMNGHLAKPIERDLLRGALTIWGGRRAAAILEEAAASHEAETLTRGDAAA